jgi:hypothetical protein
MAPAMLGPGTMQSESSPVDKVNKFLSKRHTYVKRGIVGALVAGLTIPIFGAGQFVRTVTYIAIIVTFELFLDKLMPGRNIGR